jgi:sugar lactone lactonase YvrE
MTVAGITSTPGVATNQLNRPRGLALDSSDTLYIADEYNRRVQKWLTGASSGTTVATLPIEISGPLSMFTHHVDDMDADSNGNLFIADPHNHRVLFWANGAPSPRIVAGNGRNLF